MKAILRRAEDRGKRRCDASSHAATSRSTSAGARPRRWRRRRARHPRVRSARVPGREPRARAVPPAAARRRVGRRLVRRRAHRRRARPPAAQEARRRACRWPRCGASGTGSADRPSLKRRITIADHRHRRRHARPRGSLAPRLAAFEARRRPSATCVQVADGRDGLREPRRRQTTAPVPISQPRGQPAPAPCGAPAPRGTALMVFGPAATRPTHRQLACRPPISSSLACEATGLVVSGNHGSLVYARRSRRRTAGLVVCSCSRQSSSVELGPAVRWFCSRRRSRWCSERWSPLGSASG